MNLIKEFFVCRFKKSRLKYREKIGADTGLILEEDFRDKENSRLLGLLVRAFIVMAITAGTIEGFMSIFNIPYSPAHVFLILAAANFILMLMQMNEWTRLLGYVLIIWGISVFFAQNFNLLRSGLNALANLGYELVRVKYKLPYTHGFDEIITDRSFTVPALTISCGILYMMILWETCGRFVNLTLTAVISFAVISLGLFFDGVPSMLSLILLGTGWLVSACVKFGGRSGYVFSQKKQYTVYIHKKQYYYRRRMNGKAAAQVTALVILIIGILTGILDRVVTDEMFDGAVPVSQMKEFSDYMVKDAMILAFSKYKNYVVQGSVSNGQLGHYSSVHPDYEPDLEITYVPTTFSREYLKTFVGTDYSRSGWASADGAENKAYTNMTANAAAKEGLPPHKMRIKSVDISSTTPFLPYYTDIDSNSLINYKNDTHIDMDIAPDDEYEIEYYDAPNEPVDDSGYREMAHTLYTVVPNENRELIEKICAEQGFFADDPELDTKLAEFFQNNYEYTLDPGLVPWNTDFVNYFLSENKRGLCAHFASAGTLIYRTLGIPARYVEGYVIDYPLESKEQTVLENEDIKNWYKGENVLSPAPVSIVLSDFKAHAWIEVYRDGLGWTPVEVTPIDFSLEYEEKEENDSEIGVKLIQLMFGSDDIDKSELLPDTEQYKKQAEEILGYIIFALVIIAVLYLIISAGKILLRHAKRLYKFSKRDAAAVTELYTYVADILAFLGKTENTSFNAAAKALAAYIRSPEIITDTVQQILYSPELPDNIECENAYVSLHKALEKIFEECKLSIKLKIIMDL